MPVSTIREASSAGQCVTRAQVRHIVSNLTHGTGATTGETMYFGSPQSQTLLRIYDKRLELQSKGRRTIRTTGRDGNWNSRRIVPNSVPEHCNVR